MSYRWSNKLKHCLLPLVGAMMVAFTVEGNWAMQQSPAVSPATSNLYMNSDLPEVEDISAEPLKETAQDGNVLLVVRFANRPQLDQAIGIRLDGRDLLFRDDGMDGDKQAGDGRFSAIVSLD
ncbi:MAG TPA: choice-of-anchor X domain-containing protein, partial [Blastocatellia bacterium]|nr:choice-of-anchor X domain-containing protein [Blastocatellia bacterium]